MQVKGCCPLDCQDSCSWVAVAWRRRRPRRARRGREGPSHHARRAVRQGARLRGARDGAGSAAASAAARGRQGFRRVRADLVGRGARHHRRAVQSHHRGAWRGSPAAVPVSGLDGPRSALRLAPHLSCAGREPAGRQCVRRVGLRPAGGRASDECRPGGDAAGAAHPALGPERADHLPSPVALHRAGAGERRARHRHRSAPDPHDQDVRRPSGAGAGLRRHPGGGHRPAPAGDRARRSRSGRSVGRGSRRLSQDGRALDLRGRCRRRPAWRPPQIATACGGIRDGAAGADPRRHRAAASAQRRGVRARPSARSPSWAGTGADPAGPFDPVLPAARRSGRRSRPILLKGSPRTLDMAKLAETLDPGMARRRPSKGSWSGPPIRRSPRSIGRGCGAGSRARTCSPWFATTS